MFKSTKERSLQQGRTSLIWTRGRTKSSFTLVEMMKGESRKMLFNCWGIWKQRMTADSEAKEIRGGWNGKRGRYFESAYIRKM